jgi:juvenile hormone epoxide hydrolase
MCGINTPMANIKTFIASFYPSYFVNEKYVDWMYPFYPKFVDLLQESGYMHIQATKPDTIGVALNQNPIGLAAYIMEKFSTWTNLSYRTLSDGGLEKYFSLDAILDNVMIYYLTNSITTSQRIYKEVFGDEMVNYPLDRVIVESPTGCARFRHELITQDDWIVKEKFVNIVHSTWHQDGGHFAAMQLPKILYEDYVDFVRKTLSKNIANE